MPVISATRPPIKFSQKYYNHHTAVNAKFAGYSQKGDSVLLNYEGFLSEEEVSQIISAEANYVDNDPFTHVLENIIRPARIFGQTVMDEFIASNVLLGITQYGKTSHVRKAMREVQDALTSGSLYDAMVEIRAIPVELRDPMFLSDARMLEAINRIEGYLGMPKSTTL